MNRAPLASLESLGQEKLQMYKKYEQYSKVSIGSCLVPDGRYMPSRYRRYHPAERS
jgi:hypothetical protein